jgi:hypothetical protein
MKKMMVGVRVKMCLRHAMVSLRTKRGEGRCALGRSLWVGAMDRRV